MDKNLELFKQAISEGLSNKFDNIANSCTEEIVCSEKHKLAMRTIVSGKIDAKRTPSPKARRIIAILVAAALLLTSCGIIFRDQIREIFEDLFVKVTYKDDLTEGETIEEVYTLTYVPEGYELEEKAINRLIVQYTYKNENDEFIAFEQRVLSSSDFVVDNEEGYSKITEIEDYDVYYRFTNTNHIYVWSDEKYSVKMKSSTQLSSKEVVLIIEGITTK